jgi:hypothetical protein
MRKIVFMVGCLALALAGCGQAEPAAAPTGVPAAPTPGAPHTAVPLTPAPAATAQPTEQPTPAPTPPATAIPTQGGAPSESPKPGQGGGTSVAPPPELVSAAQQQLALYLKLSPADLPLQSANAKEWPDGSLGCPAAGMVYPQVVTPGFLLIFTNAAQSTQYEVHTGRGAAQMLLCQDGQPIDLAARPAAAAPDQAGARQAELARAALAREQGLAVSDITVVAIEANEWRDSSLGCPKPGMNYLQVITPGYKVTLEARGQRYEYHTDSNQRVVRCDQP